MTQRPPAAFVVGAPRSGTTLLRLMLDAHPQLAIPPETAFVPKLIRVARSGASPEAILDLLESRRRWPDFGLERGDLLARLRALDRDEPGEAVRAFYRAYADRMGKPRWGDKTPRYVLKMNRIAEALEEARFVHVIRDGRDVAMSIAALPWRSGGVEEGAREWLDCVQRGRAQAAGLAHYLEVRYEDLLADTEPVLRTVCGFLDLPWDASLLAYHRTADRRLEEVARDTHAPGGAQTVSAAERVGIHALVSRPPDPGHIGRWRHELDDVQRATIEAVAGDLLVELGYPVDGR